MACVVAEQVPSAAQHEPVGCGQEFGLHTPPLVQAPEQAACAVTVHEPSAAQHEPVGTHAPPAQTWPGRHAPAIVTLVLQAVGHPFRDTVTLKPTVPVDPAV